MPQKAFFYTQEPAKPHEIIIGLLFFAFIGYLIVTKAIPAVTGYFGDNSRHKEICGQSPLVLNAKTNAAAKLAYKSCLKSLK